MTEIAAPPQPRRRAVRWLKRLGIGVLAFVAVLAAVLLWMNHRSRQSLAEAMAETSRLDPNWRILDLEANRTAVADDLNAALRIINLVARKPGVSFDGPEILGDTPPNQALGAEQRQKLAKLLEPHAELVRDARKLAEFSTGRFPIAYSPGFLGTKMHTEEVGRARDLVLSDLIDRIESADAAEAVRSWKAVCVVGQAIGDEPFIISQLIRTTIRRAAIDALERLLAHFELDEIALASIQAVLEADEPQPLAAFAIRGERAGGFEIFEMLQVNSVQKSSWDIWTGAIRSVASGNLTLSEALAVMPGSLPGQQAAILRFENRILAVVQQPVESWAPQLAALNVEMGSLPALARLMVPAIVKGGDAYRRSHAEMRCAIAAVAAERFRRINGRWPDALQDLVAEQLLVAVPLDPFDGEPLKLKRTSSGLTVYSVGAKGDGVTQKLSGPSNRQNAVRLWDANKRRLTSAGQP